MANCCGGKVAAAGCCGIAAGNSCCVGKVATGNSCCAGKIVAGNSCSGGKLVVGNICCILEAASNCWG